MCMKMCHKGVAAHHPSGDSKGNATSQCNKQKRLSQGRNYKMYFIRLSQSEGYLKHSFEDIKSKVKRVSPQNFALPLIAH